MQEFDVLVVGGGLAGLRAALEARKSAEVAVISKVHPVRSHSGAAQGGVNAALSSTDSWESHAFDTVKGSDYLSDQDAVDILCKEAPDRIAELDRFGVLFSRTAGGDIAQRPFGGAGFPRTCYAADRTGHHLLHAVYQQCVRQGIRIFEEWFVTKLAVEKGSVRGIVAYHIPTGEVASLGARAVVLATGGYGRIYSKSTNALIITGDGAALALDSGAPLKDMEFVQFHPTTLLGTNILISEAARGEGGRLVNAEGMRFMSRYAKDAMELAPRDIVARSIQTEIDEGRGIDGDHVDLVLTHLGAQKIKSRLPGIREISIDFAGIDPIERPIPVQPGQHYSMGGVAVDNACHSEIRGLLSAGESACVSVHGANRLGGNSLLETIVFGKIAGASASMLAKGTGTDDGGALEHARRKEEDRIDRLKSGGKAGKSSEIRSSLGKTMTDCFGIFRSAGKMQTGVRRVRELMAEFENIGVDCTDKEFNQAVIRHLELGNMLAVAQTVAVSALAREESRGSHFRTDFPKRDDGRFLKHSVVRAMGKDVEISYAPVRLGRFPVKERVY